MLGLKLIRVSKRGPDVIAANDARLSVDTVLTSFFCFFFIKVYLNFKDFAQHYLS